jgi:glycine/D-amino acid oxidase-like deaminating enzyme
VPCSRLSIPSLAAALPELARRGGIAWRPDVAVLALEGRDTGWLLRLDPLRPHCGDGDRAAAERAPAAEPNDKAAPIPGRHPAAEWTADQVVLAAGAGCRRLWPGLAPRLRCSWAGVLDLEALPLGGSPWLEPLRHGALVLPRRWRRPALEARAAELERQAWIVDPGLVPRGAGALLGQISLVRPQIDPQPPPDPTWMEERLRRGLAQLDPALAALTGRYRQVPVPFCVDGQPLLGPVDDAPGLWICTGFSAPFGSLPRQAQVLAAAVLARSG